MNVKNRYVRVCFIALVLVMFFPTVMQAGEARPQNSETPDSYWSLLGGYGISHKGLGLTKVQVQVLDIILQYDGKKIDDDDHLISLVKLSEIGKQVELVVFRNGKLLTKLAQIGTSE